MAEQNTTDNIVFVTVLTLLVILQLTTVRLTDADKWDTQSAQSYSERTVTENSVAAINSSGFTTNAGKIRIDEKYCDSLLYLNETDFLQTLIEKKATKPTIQ